jgi:pilus assembly protein TadC
MIGAALLLAGAVLIASETPRLSGYVRIGASATPNGSTTRREKAHRRTEPLAAAFALDVLAACLRSGMAVSTAAAATAVSAPPELRRVLDRAADMLSLGADPSVAWSDPAGRLDTRADALMRLARRSAASGSALAESVSELATQFRADAADSAGAAAERASVLIAGPLGVCYLPAFVCLGIVPVVVGLAGDVLQSGIL